MKKRLKKRSVPPREHDFSRSERACEARCESARFGAASSSSGRESRDTVYRRYSANRALWRGFAGKRTLRVGRRGARVRGPLIELRRRGSSGSATAPAVGGSAAAARCSWTRPSAGGQAPRAGGGRRRRLGCRGARRGLGGGAVTRSSAYDGSATEPRSQRVDPAGFLHLLARAERDRDREQHADTAPDRRLVVEDRRILITAKNRISVPSRAAVIAVRDRQLESIAASRTTSQASGRWSRAPARCPRSRAMR